MDRQVWALLAALVVIFAGAILINLGTTSDPPSVFLEVLGAVLALAASVFVIGVKMDWWFRE